MRGHTVLCMLEILIILALAMTPVMAARKGKRRRSAGFRVVRVKGSVALATLANLTVVKASLFVNGGQRQFIIAADLTWTLMNATATEGPFYCGLAHNDYTVAEIKEWIESGAGVETNQIEQEKNRRLCRDSIVFSGVGTEEVANDGKPKRTKVRFHVEDSQELAFWVYNDSDATLAGGAIVNCYGKVYVRRS